MRILKAGSLLSEINMAIKVALLEIKEILKKINLPQSIDLFLSSSTLHWMADLPAFFKKIHTLLKMGARAYFSLYIKGNLAEISAYVKQLNYYSTEELKILT